MNEGGNNYGIRYWRFMYRLWFMCRFMSCRRYQRQRRRICYRWFSVHLMWCLRRLMSCRNYLRGVICRPGFIRTDIINYIYYTIIKKTERVCALFSILSNILSLCSHSPKPLRYSPINCLRRYTIHFPTCSSASHIPLLIQQPPHQ